jgi:hypothetical protein
VTFPSPQEDIAEALRSELHARAAHLGQPSAPFVRLEAAVRRDRTRRRSLAGCVGLALIAAIATSVTTVGGTHRTDTLSTAAGNAGMSSLLEMAARGNLVDHTDFMREVSARLGPGAAILFANDDGQHTVVIGVDDQPGAQNHSGAYDTFTVLVGTHDAKAADLSPSGTVGMSPDNAIDTYTFVGEFTGDGKSAPYVVLGPSNMTEVDIASDIQLGVDGGKLVAKHTDIATVAAKAGAAAGEIPGPSNANAAARLGVYVAFRARLSTGATMEADPDTRTTRAFPGESPTSAAYDSLRTAVVAVGRTDGLTNLQLTGPGGDAVADNVAQVVSDVTRMAGVDASRVDVHVDWVGQETPAWDSALLDIEVPGLPHLQAFVRGLAPGQPDSQSPGLAQSYVRPAQTLTPGRFPETAQVFGGTPELTTLGLGVAAVW